MPSPGKDPMIAVTQRYFTQKNKSILTEVEGLFFFPCEISSKTN